MGKDPLPIILGLPDATFFTFPDGYAAVHYVDDHDGGINLMLSDRYPDIQCFGYEKTLLKHILGDLLHNDDKLTKDISIMIVSNEATKFVNPVQTPIILWYCPLYVQQKHNKRGSILTLL